MFLYMKRGNTADFFFSRVRYQVSSAHPLNFTVECSKFADTLKQYSMDDANGSLFIH